MAKRNKAEEKRRRARFNRIGLRERARTGWTLSKRVLDATIIASVQLCSTVLATFGQLRALFRRDETSQRESLVDYIQASFIDVWYIFGFVLAAYMLKIPQQEIVLHSCIAFATFGVVRVTEYRHRKKEMHEQYEVCTLMRGPASIVSKEICTGYENWKKLFDRIHGLSVACWCFAAFLAVLSMREAHLHVHTKPETDEQATSHAPLKVAANDSESGAKEELPDDAIRFRNLCIFFATGAFSLAVVPTVSCRYWEYGANCRSKLRKAILEV